MAGSRSGPSEASEVWPIESKVAKAMLLSVTSNLASLRVEFVKGVGTEVLNQLLDDLLANNILNQGEKDSILEEHRSRADRARVLFDSVARKGNEPIKSMMDLLQTRDPALYSDLMPHDLR